MASEWALNACFPPSDFRFTPSVASLVSAFNVGTSKVQILNTRQNQPNPFREETVIGFYLPEVAEATLVISDVSGKVVKLLRIQGVRGYNSVSLRRDELPTGVLQYTVKTDEHTDTKTMIITD